MGKEEGGKLDSALEIEIHPSFMKLIEICRKIGFGTIKELKIQNGLPVFITYDIKTELDAVIEKTEKLV